MWRIKGSSILCLSLVAGALLVPACSKSLSDADKAELLGKIDAVLKDAEAKETQRKSAVKEILSKPQLKTKPCTEVVLLDFDGKPVESNRYAPSVSTPNALFAKEFNKLQSMQGRRLTQLKKDMKLLRNQVEGKAVGAEPITPETLAWARQRIASRGADWFPFEIHFVLHNIQYNIVDPKTGHHSPSHVEARAFVWDYRHGVVACQADFQKTLNAGDSVRVVYDRRRGLKKDDVDLAYDYGLVVDVERGVFSAMGLGAATTP